MARHIDEDGLLIEEKEKSWSGYCLFIHLPRPIFMV